ncbi:hypothetical protein ABGB17_10665 [Sphaerisporangium sp. B11E5]|uniref:dCTP deaminase domain-containing protein n=1 Tax=Sphaerisporangium sp. B11E5 TaxID=3153563 RepID=UPI00325EB522
MLTADEITVHIGRGAISWQGDLRGDALLLRLGSPLQPLADVGQVVDLADQADIDTLYEQPRHDWNDFELAPGRMALCAVAQPLRLGAGFAAAIGTLSHLARVGLATHVCSPWVMPGWDGHLTLELLNLGPATLRLHHAMPVARAIILVMDGTPSGASAHADYGRTGHLGSRYAAEFGGEFKRELPVTATSTAGT